MPRGRNRDRRTPRDHRTAVIEDGVLRGEVMEANPLPGENSIDNAAVDKAVRDLNRIQESKGLELALALGHYVVDAFFNGDLDTFRSRAQNHVSFRALADRLDLKPRYRFLLTCVAVVDQMGDMPKEVATSLSLTHHRALLPVKNREVKLTLAETAVKENLTTRDLEREVRRVDPQRERSSPRGRPARNPILATLSRIEREVSRLVEEALAFTEPGQAEAAMEQLERAIAQMTQVHEELAVLLEEAV